MIVVHEQDGRQINEKIKEQASEGIDCCFVCFFCIGSLESNQFVAASIFGSIRVVSLWFFFIVSTHFSFVFRWFLLVLPVFPMIKKRLTFSFDALSLPSHAFYQPLFISLLLLVARRFTHETRNVFFFNFKTQTNSSIHSKRSREIAA